MDENGKMILEYLENVERAFIKLLSAFKRGSIQRFAEQYEYIRHMIDDVFGSRLPMRFANSLYFMLDKLGEGYAASQRAELIYIYADYVQISIQIHSYIVQGGAL